MYHKIMKVVARGQTGLQGVVIGIFIILLVLVVFAILFGYMQEQVLPALGLNQTAPKVENIVSKAFNITDVVAALLLLIAVASVLFLVVRWISSRSE